MGKVWNDEKFPYSPTYKANRFKIHMQDNKFKVSEGKVLCKVGLPERLTTNFDEVTCNKCKKKVLLPLKEARNNLLETLYLAYKESKIYDAEKVKSSSWNPSVSAQLKDKINKIYEELKRCS